MKRLLVLILTFVFVLSLISCVAGENGDKLPNKTAEELVAEENYIDAYRVLLAKGDENSEIKLDDFISLPKKTIQTDIRGNKATYNFTWDSEGKPVKAVASSGNLTYEIAYTYGENTFSCSRNGALMEVYTLNEKGLITQSVHYENDGSIYRTIDYTYDEKGNLLREYSVIIGNEYPSIHTYTYDEAGRLIKEKDDYGHSYDEKNYAYDGVGRLVKETTTYSYSDEVSEETFTYNDKGQMVGMVQEKTENGEKEITYKTTITYNENGKPVSILKDDMDMDGYINLYEWTYDNYGNLIKEVRTSGYEGQEKNVYVVEHEDYTVFYTPKLHAVMDEILESYQPDID